jgi:hypothetical protein
VKDTCSMQRRPDWRKAPEYKILMPKVEIGDESVSKKTISKKKQYLLAEERMLPDISQEQSEN